MPAPAGNLPVWNTGGANRTEPNGAKKILGWTNGESPPAGYFNWWMNKVGEWIDYLSTFLTDAHTWVAKQTFQGLVQIDGLPGSAQPALKTTGDSDGGSTAIDARAGASTNTIALFALASPYTSSIAGYFVAEDNTNSLALYAQGGDAAGAYAIRVAGGDVTSAIYSEAGTAADTYALDAVGGSGSGSAGVHGQAGSSVNGMGLFGEAGNANNLAGVYGESNHADAYGVAAVKTTGNGANSAALFADGSAASCYGAVISGDPTTPTRSALRIVPQDTQPAQGQVGDIYMNSGDSKLYVCTVAGTPGTWVVVGSQS